MLTASFTPFGGVEPDMFDELDRPDKEELAKMVKWSKSSCANALEVGIRSLVHDTAGESSLMSPTACYPIGVKKIGRSAINSTHYRFYLHG